jgi:hypothetical protein
MKGIGLFIIIFIFCQGFKSDLLEKLDNVISGSNTSNSLIKSNLNDLKITEDISESIKNLLDESTDKNNIENLKSVVNSIHDELYDEKNENFSGVKTNSKLYSPSENKKKALGNFQNNLRPNFRFIQNKDNSNINQNFNKIEKNASILSESLDYLKKPILTDPYELTLKIMQYSKERKKTQKLNSQLNINSPNSSSGYLSVSKPTNNDVIFEHIYINLNGEKKLPNTNSNFLYDQVNNEFIVPEDSKKIYTTDYSLF